MAKYDADLDPLFAALADGTRRAIVGRLARGPASVGELAGDHDIALPTFLAHLRKLEAAGLVATRKKGRVRTCHLVPGGAAPAVGWLQEQRTLWQTRLDQFDDYVTNLAKDTTHGPRSED